MRRLDEDIEPHRSKYHTIELVLDRLKVEPKKSSRTAEAIEQALALANGLVAIVRGEGDDYRVFSTLRACPTVLNHNVRPGHGRGCSKRCALVVALTDHRLWRSRFRGAIVIEG